MHHFEPKKKWKKHKVARKRDQSWDFSMKESRIDQQTYVKVQKRRRHFLLCFFKGAFLAIHVSLLAIFLGHCTTILPSMHRSSVHCTAKYIVVFPFKIECALLYNRISYRKRLDGMGVYVCVYILLLIQAACLDTIIYSLQFHSANKRTDPTLSHS